MSAGAFSQNSQTSKDSIPVKITDMDAATEKMHQGKMYKQLYKASTEAVEACDSIKAKQYETISLLEGSRDAWAVIADNNKANAASWEKVAIIEKKKKNRNTFLGFSAGTITGLIIAAVIKSRQ